MSEVNIEIAEELAIRLIPEQITIKMLRNGKVGEVTRESVLILMKRCEQIGFNAQGEAYKLGMSLWIKNKGGIDYFETNQDAVDELSLSLGVDLPN